LQILKGLASGLAGFLLFIALPLLGLVYTINSTMLNPQFAVKEITKLDAVEVIREAIADQILSDDELYVSAVDSTLLEIKPWINQQIEYAVNRCYDYMLGKTDTFSISINTEEIKPVIVENVTRAFLQSSPEAYSQLPVAEQDILLADFQQQIDETIPNNVEISQNEIPQDAWQALQQAKQIIGYIRVTYFALIAFSLILISGIVMIFREPKGILRTLGIIFLIDGVLGLTGYLMLNHFIPLTIPANDLPHLLQLWIPGFIKACLSPMELYTIIILATGIILLTISFFIRRNRAAAVSNSID
jgi:hypothetical protein